MRRWHTQPHEKDLQRPFVCVAWGTGIGIAFGIESGIDGRSRTDADSNPDTDSDPGNSR